MRFEFRGLDVDPSRITIGRPIVRVTESGESFATGVAFSFAADAKDRALLDKKLELEELIEWCDVLFSQVPVPEYVAVSAPGSFGDHRKAARKHRVVDACPITIGLGFGDELRRHEDDCPSCVAAPSVSPVSPVRRVQFVLVNV